MTPKSKPGVALPGLTGISASTQIKASTSTETPSNDFFSESSQFPPMKPAEADAPPPPIPAKPKPKSSLPPTPVDAAAAPTDFFAASAVEPEKKEIPMTPKSKPGVALPGLAAVGVSAEVKAEVPMEDSEWDVSITADELAEYRRMFRGCKTNEAGKIGGGDVKRLWMQKRRNSDLKEIYILAKRDRSDKKAELSEVEFIMGLYIISRRNAGAPLPRIVTETEWLRLDAILAEDDAKASASAATSEVVMPPMREAPMPPMPPMPPMAEKPIVAAAAPEEDKAEDVPPRLPPKPSTPSGDLLLLGNNGGNSNGSDSEQQQPPQLPPLPPKISLELPMQPPAVPAPEVPLSERKAAGEEGSGNDGDDDDDDDAGDAPQLPARPTKVAVPPTLVVPPTVKAAPPATPPTLTIPGKEPTEHQEEGEEEGDAPPMPPKPQNMLAAPLTVDSEDVDFELAPSLPPRSRPRATDLGAWMKEYKIDPSVQEVFLAKGVKVSALLGLTEESLTALGVHRLRKRLDVYYAVWLSRKELSDKHHHSHRSHTDKSSSGSTAAAAAAAGGGGGSGAAGSGRKSRKEALKPRGRQSRSRSFAAPDDQRAPPNLSVPTDDSAAAAAAAERRRKDEKKRRQQSRAIRRQLSDNEGSDSSDSDNNSSKSFSDNETPIPELTMTVPSASAAGGEQPMAETRRSRSPSPTAPAPKQHIRGRKRGGAFSRRAGPGGAGGTGLAKPSGPSVAPPPKLVITPGRTLDERKTRTQEEAARESAELMHALFVAGQVRMFFLETYGPRRRVAESILTELRDYVAKVKKYAFALKTTKDGGGFSDEEYTLFTPLVETAGVPDEVSSALGARFAAWNKLTTTSDCFNKCFGLWMQKFGEWFIHRGRNIYAIEKCTARSKKFKNSIKACEEMGGSQDSPVPIGTFYEYPTKFMTSLCMLFTVNTFIIQLLSYTRCHCIYCACMCVCVCTYSNSKTARLQDTLTAME